MFKYEIFSKKQFAKIDWSNFLFFGCLSFLVGVFIFTFLSFDGVRIFFVAMVFFAVISYFLFFKNKSVLLLFFVILSFCFGTWMIEDEKAGIKKSVGSEKQTGYFVITDLPERKEDYQKIVGCFQQEKDSLKILDCDEKTLIFGTSSDVFDFGDSFRMECQMALPENKYENFNYVRYLANDDIYQICSKPKFIEKIGVVGSLEKAGVQLDQVSLLKIKIFKIIYNVREKVEKQIKHDFPEPGAAYLSGLLLGGADRLPEELSENFRKTGTTHAVAVSGYNITIIASFLMWLGIMIGFWRQKAFWFAVVGIVFFVFMIGAPSSAIRAAIMGVLVLWAAKNGKLANSWRAIVIVAFLMVAFSPFSLVYDAGFQLSFLATISLIFLYAPLSDKFEITNDFLEIKSILLMTIVAQLGVLGLMIYVFNSFSLISLLANLIILPLIPVIMLGGFLVVILGFFVPFLSGILAMPVGLLLNFEIKTISFLAKFEWVDVKVENLSVWWLIGYYVFFIGLVLKYNFSLNIKKKDVTEIY